MNKGINKTYKYRYKEPSIMYLLNQQTYGLCPEIMEMPISLENLFYFYPIRGLKQIRNAMNQ